MILAAILAVTVGIIALSMYAGHLIGYADGYATGWLDHQREVAMTPPLELCPDCRGERRIIHNGQPVRCPQCEGTGLRRVGQD